MKKPALNSRRDVIKALSIGTATSLVAASTTRAESVTPSQTEGPFYPDIDNDLTFVNSRKDRAKGDYLYVYGIVQDTEGNPVNGSLVEIWQTDFQGIYDHAGDENHAKKDPNFQSFGRCVTNAQGHYIFKTIRPRYYAAGRGFRTPHIHYKVWRRGFHDLTTQLYFEGESKNAEDGLYRQLSDDEQKRVTISLRPATDVHPKVQERLSSDFKDQAPVSHSLIGRFDIVLKIVSES